MTSVWRLPDNEPSLTHWDQDETDTIFLLFAVGGDNNFTSIKHICNESANLIESHDAAFDNNNGSNLA